MDVEEICFSLFVFIKLISCERVMVASTLAPHCMFLLKIVLPDDPKNCSVQDTLLAKEIVDNETQTHNLLASLNAKCMH